jgi:hypothetical protein
MQDLDEQLDGKRPTLAASMLLKRQNQGLDGAK